MSQKIIEFVNAHLSMARANALDPLEYIPHVLVIRDTSGSNADDEFVKQATFSDEIARGVSATITYASADTTIRQTLTKNPGEPMLQYEQILIDECGRGGTDMFRAIAAGLVFGEVQYDAVVVLTDGHTLPVKLSDLQSIMAELGGNSLFVPPIAFAITQNDGVNNMIKVLTAQCTGYRDGAFMSDYIDVSTRATAPGL